MTHIRLTCAALLLLATGCAAAPRGAEPPGPAVNPTEISSEEVHVSSASDAYDAVQTLRPAWLQTRGRSTIRRIEFDRAGFEEGIMVYMDNQRLGGTPALRQIEASAIKHIQFLDAATATQQWGTNHTHGAIHVLTK